MRGAQRSEAFYSAVEADITRIVEGAIEDVGGDVPEALRLLARGWALTNLENDMLRTGRMHPTVQAKFDELLRRPTPQPAGRH